MLAKCHEYLQQLPAMRHQEPIESNDKGACNCVLRNVDGEIQTWHPILFFSKFAHCHVWLKRDVTC